MSSIKHLKAIDHMVIDREQAMRQLAEHEISQLSDEQKLNLVLDYWYLFEDFDLSHELKFFLANHEAESLTEYTDFSASSSLLDWRINVKYSTTNT